MKLDMTSLTFSLQTAEERLDAEEKQKRKEEAVSYYQKALNNGAQPDQALEKRLKG